MWHERQQSLGSQSGRSIGSSKRLTGRGMRWLTPMVVLGWLALSASPAGAASLTWNANTESDLAGYKVYRCSLTAPTCDRSNGTLTADVRLATRFDLTGTGYGIPGRERKWFITPYDTFSNESAGTAPIKTDFSSPIPPPPPPPPPPTDETPPEVPSGLRIIIEISGANPEDVRIRVERR